MRGGVCTLVRDGEPRPKNVAKVRKELEDDGAIVIDRSEKFVDLVEDDVSESDIFFAVNFKNGN